MTSLFEPIEAGSLRLPNRIAMAPLTRNRAPDAIPTPLMQTYYVQRASAGLLISEGSGGHPTPVVHYMHLGLHLLTQRTFKVARDNACRTQLLAKLAGRVSKLAHDAVERRTGAAGINARIGKLADDGDRTLQAHAQRIGHGRGIAQRLRQPFHAGTSGIGTQCQDIGDTVSIVK